MVQAFIFTRYPPPEGVSGPRLVQLFIFTRYPSPGRRIRTASGPSVHLHSLSATQGRQFPDPEWSSRSSSLAIRRQEGAIRDPEWSRRSSSLAIRRRKAYPDRDLVQPFIFTRYPASGRRIRTATGPSVHLIHSLSATREGTQNPSGPAVHLHSLSAAGPEGVSEPRAVQAFILTLCAARNSP